MAIDGSGRLFGWGKIQGGRVGSGAMRGGKSGGQSRVQTPREIVFDFDQPASEDGDDTPTPTPTVTVTDVSAGEKHTAVIAHSRVYTFGCSDAGQLGTGKLSSSAIPSLVPSLASTPILAVSCGVNHTVAVTRRGTAYSWGWGENGRLGLGADTSKRLVPTLISSLQDDLTYVSSVACGDRHTVLTTDSGDILSFGWNLYGQCGIGISTMASSSADVALDLDSGGERAASKPCDRRVRNCERSDPAKSYSSCD